MFNIARYEGSSGSDDDVRHDLRVAQDRLKALNAKVAGKKRKRSPLVTEGLPLRSTEANPTGAPSGEQADISEKKKLRLKKKLKKQKGRKKHEKIVKAKKAREHVQRSDASDFDDSDSVDTGKEHAQSSEDGIDHDASSETEQADRVPNDAPPSPPRTASKEPSISPSPTLKPFEIAQGPAVLLNKSPNLGIPQWLARPKTVDPDKLVPLESASFSKDLSAQTLKRAEEASIERWFPVQNAVIPRLLMSRQLYPHASHAKPGDVCVSAPTGSGKTLAYVVPVVEILRPRVVVRLRALVILPTRDLVSQVRETFDQFTKGTNLNVGIATGQHSFAHEQAMIVGDVKEDLRGGQSKVDILITTPGRLVDHVNSTKGFTLQHLRFLIIDEADRLMNQSFQDWLPRILHEIEEGNDAGDVQVKGDAIAPRLALSDGISVRAPSPTQKLLFSATLTRNPGKIASLNLFKPLYIAVQHAPNEDEDDDDAGKFTLPSTLKQRMITLDTDEKPLVLLHLVYNLKQRGILCFTKSVENARRLCLLLQAFASSRPIPDRVIVADYTSDLSKQERNKLLARFKSGEVAMLVCSDLIARGMDLPHVRHIINYDVPSHMKKYVHRVGRTARAGKEGDAWSLVEKQEAKFFKDMLKKAHQLDSVEKVKIKSTEYQELVDDYEKALANLKTKMTGSY